MLGFVAENVLSGRVRFVSPWELEGRTVVDVSEPEERMVFQMPGSLHIPLGQLRQRLHELPRNTELVLYCAIGVRAYNGARILMQNGFDQVRVLEGGSSFYKSMQYRPTARFGQPRPDSTPTASAAPVQTLDCCGLQCPGPIMKVSQALGSMEPGQTLRVSATDMGFARDVESWCNRTGNTYVGVERRGRENIVTLQKGGTAGVARPAASAPDGKTIIVFDGDMDKVMASLIIANGAAAMGRKVTMFYTFWGLNALRKREKVQVKKNLMERMFGAMMPRGLGRLKLSNLDMLGMGRTMMKQVMKQKNVASLEELMAQAMANGVKMIACTMSMDVMGIREEELIDGVELAGVATYLGDAENASVNLFI